jgi:maleylpyruvate isomerase
VRDVRSVSSLVGCGAEIDRAVVARTSAIVRALNALDEDALHAPSRLPAWSQLTIACHLRYGGETLARMTIDVAAGRPASYYPEGRARQRDGTLRPREGETARDVIASLACAGDALHEAWARLDDDLWALVAHEPADNRDLGSVSLVELALLRLTEVEVHGADLDLGLPDWSARFVELALPFRFARLKARRPDPRAGDLPASASWLFVARDGPAFRVGISGEVVESRPARADETADAVIDGSSRDLLAVLLGRPRREPIGLRGDPHVAEMFQRVFPGP